MQYIKYFFGNYNGSVDNAYKYTGPELPKDLYEYVTNFVDDKTILNMLSVNKKYNQDEFYRRVLFRNYPHLLNFKGDETFKQLFIRMTRAIFKLEKKYRIPYIPVKTYNPVLLSRTFHRQIYNDALGYACLSTDLKLIIRLMDRCSEFDAGIYSAAAEGNLELVKFFTSQVAGVRHHITDAAIAIAAEKGYRDIVYLLMQYALYGRDFFYNLPLISAARGGHIDLVQLFLDQGAYNVNEALISASSSGHMDIVKLLLEQGATDFNTSL